MNLDVIAYKYGDVIGFQIGENIPHGEWDEDKAEQLCRGGKLYALVEILQSMKIILDFPIVVKLSLWERCFAECQKRLNDDYKADVSKDDPYAYNQISIDNLLAVKRFLHTCRDGLTDDNFIVWKIYKLWDSNDKQPMRVLSRDYPNPRLEYQDASEFA